MSVALLCVVVLLAQGEIPEAGVEPPTTEAPPSQAPPPVPVAEKGFWKNELWQPHWRKFGVFDYAGTVLTAGALIGFEQLNVHERLVSIGGRNQFEGPIADFFSLNTVHGRDEAADISDHILFNSQWYPYLLDGILVPLLVHRDPETMWQMSMMNVQAFAVSTLIVRMGHRFVARDRPALARCSNDPGYYYGCDNIGAFGNYSSFLSGHVSVVATAAGLTCAHHQHVPLYGGGFWDDFACGSMLTLTGIQGVLRMMADKHYVSDMVLGTLIGLAAGYAIPTYLHYEWNPLPKSELKVSLLPQVTDTTTGVSVFGQF
ncbi:MAG: phosphatase PAP2 family protein [Myxococcota bacterium]